MKVALTFDTDWAPDYVLEHVFEILLSFDLPATFFFTNQTGISVPGSVEVGLHPDFRNSSPQGAH
jgi:peptidoglycan/xylan/chitin deacetylase (PgdA/CDA1 family)